MSLNLIPDYKFETFDAVTAEFLLSIGAKCVLLDIDNTLEPYENPKPGERVLAWLASLDNVGISYAIISNNNSERVEIFTSGLDITAYAVSCKPFKRNLLRAMAELKVTACETVFIGDQIFTDVWAAHNAGARAIIVPPIEDKKDIFTRFKRFLERPFMKQYEKRKGR